MKLASVILLVFAFPAICLAYSSADFNEDEIVNFQDFSVFAYEYLKDPNMLASNTTRRRTGGVATFVVAASNATPDLKARADYVCDGVDDQVEIQAAINAVRNYWGAGGAGGYGGTVVLLPGLYSCSDSIQLKNRVNIKGTGNLQNTVVEFESGSNCDGFVFDCSDSNHRGQFAIENLLIRNKNNGTYWGMKITASGDELYDTILKRIYFAGAGNSSDQTGGNLYIEKSWSLRIENCWFEHSRGKGAQLGAANQVRITNSYFAHNDSDGLYLAHTTGSILACGFDDNGAGDTGNGLTVYSGDNISIVNCVAKRNYGHGFRLAGLNFGKVIGCTAYDNDRAGIWGKSGFYFGGSTNKGHIAVACTSYDNNTSNNGIGFMVASPKVKLLGCVAKGNAYGVRLESVATDTLIDCIFEGNTHNLSVHNNARYTFLPAHYTSEVSSSQTINNYDNGRIYQIDASTTTVTLFLPAAVPGLEYTFYVTNGTNQVRIDPSGTEEIYEDNTGKGAGVYIYSTENGASMKLRCVKSGRWEMLDKNGTWNTGT